MQATDFQAAYEAFWRDLVAGSIKPGEQLSEESLSIRWKLGRTPVRDALVRLESEGLVERRHRVGTIVRAPAEDELRELRELRIAIEGVVLRHVAEAASAEQLDRLEQLAIGVDTLESQPASQESFDAESRFHMALVEISGLRHVGRMLKLQRLYMRSFRLTVALHKGDRTTPSRKHQDLVAILRKRDGDGAAALLAKHLS